jgi:hypothetical protein
MTFSLKSVTLTVNRHIVNVTGYKQDVVRWSLGPQKGAEQTDAMKQRVLSVTQQMYTVASITVYGLAFSNCTTLLHALSIAHNRRVCKRNITLVCKFITNHLNWKNHSDQVIPKLSGVWYAVHSTLRISNIESFKTIHFAYYYSLIKYRKIILQNSAHRNNIFTLKLLEFWSVQNLEIHLKACLRDYNIYLFRVNTYCHQ